MVRTELSNEANIGKILILVGIVLHTLSLILILFMSFFGIFIQFLGWSLTIYGLVGIVGLVYGIFAYTQCSKGNFHKAGIFGIISSVLPPLDVIMLIGAVLCLISKEGKK
jgi:hypothetical protein